MDRGCTGVVRLVRALAVGVVVLLGLGCVGGYRPAVLPVAMSIFIDGTKDMVQQPFDRLRATLGGQFGQPDPADNVFVDYPRSLGIVTGLFDPGFDVSERAGTAGILAAIDAARAAGQDAIYVVGFSQGAAAAVKARTALAAGSGAPAGSGTDADTGAGPAAADVTFVLVANPRRNDGGLLTRLPGLYVPLLGVTLGGGTPDAGAPVIQVARQYDGITDAPRYLLNPLADLNAVLGFFYLHLGFYQEIDLATADTVVTYSADGSVMDILVLTPEGQLPLTRPLLDLGVPAAFVEALDPLLRAIIETGYDRPAPGSVFPSQPVTFALLPPITRWIDDLHAVVDGAGETVRRLAALAGLPVPRAEMPQPELPQGVAGRDRGTPSAGDEAVGRSGDAEDAELRTRAERLTGSDEPGPRIRGGNKWRPGELAQRPGPRRPGPARGAPEDTVDEVVAPTAGEPVPGESSDGPARPADEPAAEAA